MMTKICIIIICIFGYLSVTFSFTIDRRTFVSGSLLITQIEQREQPETVTVPLEWIDPLNAYIVRYNIQGERFGAIVDTGSPFLTIPNDCFKWGCYKPETVLETNLPPTIERFDNNEGEVYWKQGRFSFVNATGSLYGPQFVTFGVLSQTLINGSGGVFLGLVRDTDSWIRPSFLSQYGVRSFALDLNRQKPTLTLSKRETLMQKPIEDVIPLVKELNRKYGDPTIHYTARATQLFANGQPIVKDNRPLYVIFDSGVSGMVVSRELFEDRYAQARRNREKNLWGDVRVQLKSKQGKLLDLSAQRPVTTPLGETPWPNFRAHLVVVGLAFLDGKRITIDIDRQELQIL